MVQKVSRDEKMGVVLFSEEEVGEMCGLKRGPDYIEVTCGCTNRRYGDAIGILRVFASGALQITCQCIPDCKEEKLTPAEFEKHSGRLGVRKWKSNVWVTVRGKKVPLWRTSLLKYNKDTQYEANDACSSRARRNCHRDEFVCCSKCNKERRFRLRTKEECRVYHDALADRNWKCVDMPGNKLVCDDDKERGSRKSCRGCPRSGTCGGCTSCVCFGCQKCRFPDCECRTCADFFLHNPKP